jgi:hypothetical protein
MTARTALWRASATTDGSLRYPLTMAPSRSITLGADCLGDDPENIGHVTGCLPGLADRIALTCR